MARVSTEEQAASDRHSMPMQVMQLREFASREGHEVVAVFEIRGESAYGDELASRPEFSAVLEAAERREFDALLVYDFSRFARSQVVAHTALYRLRRAGVRLFGANGIDYTEEEDWAGIEAVFARRASRDHGRRVRDAYGRKHAIGLPTGDIPFGYRWPEGRADVAPVVVPEEAEAIRWAFREYASSGSLLEIAREWNRRGLRPRSKGRRVGGRVREAFGEFVPSSVQRVLESRFYLGFVSWRGNERRGLHEAIVDEELWASVQRRKRGARRRPRREALLSGLAVCRSCGSALWNEGSGSGVRYYRERKRGREVECSNAVGRGWREDAVHAEVAAAFSAMGLDDGWLRKVEVEARRLNAGSNRAVVARREELEEQVKRAGYALVRGSLGVAEHDALVEELRREMGVLPPANVERVVFSAERLRGIGQVWEVATEGERREWVREVLEAVEFEVGEERRVWLRPWEEYEPLFAARLWWSYLRPGGVARNKPTFVLSSGGLYLPAELVA